MKKGESIECIRCHKLFKPSRRGIKSCMKCMSWVARDTKFFNNTKYPTYKSGIWNPQTVV